MRPNEDVRAHIDAALGDLSSEVELSIIQAGEYTRSPTDTPLYSALEKVAQRVYPDATLMPVMTVGGTDAALLSATPDRWHTASG